MEILVNNKLFLGIKVGETTFKEAGLILDKLSYKQPVKDTRFVYWKPGNCSIVISEYYKIKIQDSRVELNLWGDSIVNRISISHKATSKPLSINGIILGKTKVKELNFGEDDWKINYNSKVKSYLTRNVNGLRVDIAGKLDDDKSINWKSRKIKTVTITRW